MSDGDRRWLCVFCSVAAIIGLAAGTAHAGNDYDDPSLGVHVTLPAGWQVTPLPAGEANGNAPGWQVGFAGPASIAAAQRNMQPLTNPRYQDILLKMETGVEAMDFESVVILQCRGASNGPPTPVQHFKIGDLRAARCAASRATGGGDVSVIEETEETFIQGHDGRLWHFSWEGKQLDDETMVTPPFPSAYRRIVATFRELPAKTVAEPAQGSLP